MQTVVVVESDNPISVQNLNEWLAEGWVVVRADRLNGFSAEMYSYLPALYYVLEKID